MTTDLLWYKDAVFYELHVRSFFDSNDDGQGDFQGATRKLDYLNKLGITCIWLLPFYPSPLKDDGYDISDFYNVHPDLGTLEDFRTFIEEAHKRGIKVIADMVFNHVSSQHPWFQEARTSKTSTHRDWFVWSDTPDTYSGVRIIFSDTEPSNWTYDHLAKEYYWHRFFHHQPDLNYDNPALREEMKNIVRFWLNFGLDGFRCDAVPYLFEREGTSCDNLPETHAFFKEIRGCVDTEFPGTVLLAEANLWPTEAISYFGNDDEFNMAFNFPLMPRMYLGLAQEQRRPITDIIQQITDIPANSQWANFLRNHDELTLEMVTDEERDIMYREYAKHPKMRLNLGIRRRLTPLLDRDRITIEMLYALLFALPGSPVIYYGDEIGMGDNVALGDRNGVRTPMQWTSDVNAGFSSADTELLYLPVVANSFFHYQTVNVRAEERIHTSLLNWLKRMIHLRQSTQVFGRGTITLLHPDNKHVLAFVREYKDEHIVCVYNLKKTPTYCFLNLGTYTGRTPVEMKGGERFPVIGDNPYALSLTGRGFYWLKLEN